MAPLVSGPSHQARGQYCYLDRLLRNPMEIRKLSQNIDIKFKYFYIHWSWLIYFEKLSFVLRSLLYSIAVIVHVTATPAKMSQIKTQLAKLSCKKLVCDAKKFETAALGN